MGEIETSLPVPAGEALGSVLIGLLYSLRDEQVGLSKELGYLTKHIQANEWYPMAYFFRALEEAMGIKGNLAPLLFQGGARFMDNFFYLNGGKTIAPCAADFLSLLSKNGGYSLMHRGDPSDVGWQDLLELDESEGRAVVVSITPYPVEFERGAMHRGTSIGGDVESVNVESIEKPYSRCLKKKTHTITFKQKKQA